MQYVNYSQVISILYFLIKQKVKMNLDKEGIHETPGFNTISKEVMAEIFSYLDKSSKLVSRSVCKEWKYILDTYFFEFHGIVSDGSLSDIKNSDVEFETLTIKELFHPIPHEPATLSRNKLALSPTKLIFKPRRNNNNNISNDDYVNEDELFPSPFSTTLDENISKMIVYNRNSKELIFEKNSLQYIHLLDVRGLLMPQLKQLEIRLSDQMSYHEEFVLFQLGSMKTPSLTKLILDSTKVALVYDEWHAVRHYMNLFKFLAQHKTVKSLEFRYFYRRVPLYLDNMERPLPLSDKQLDLLKRNLSQIKLKEFNFRFTHQEGCGPYNLGFHLLSYQTCLEHLEVHVPSGVEFAPMYMEVKNAVERNSGTLTHFGIHQYILMPSIEEVHTIMEALTCCPVLESLQLFLYSIPTFPYKLSKTIKKLTFLGNLRPSLLLEIKSAFPNLEYLEFSNMTSVVGRAREELRNNLKSVLRMPQLKCLKWYVDGFDMNFLSDFPGITVKRISKNIFIFMIVILGSN